MTCHLPRHVYLVQRAGFTCTWSRDIFWQIHCAEHFLFRGTDAIMPGMASAQFKTRYEVINVRMLPICFSISWNETFHHGRSRCLTCTRWFER